ncbi:MAG TPA: selenium-binding protein SBP56-related protein [Thermomicrobiales bacterium]|nr:selenium-binding protein SBP56-related protein [Thermomicrobiales bacterium]
MSGYEHHAHHEHHADGQSVGYASPQEARQAPPEDFLYVAALHTGTGVDEPDFLAVVDVNPQSDTYGRITHRTSMPGVGDELHHYGWQVCSSACHTDLKRQHLVVPGFRTSNLHIVDVGTDPRRPEIVKVVEGAEVARKTGLGAPHTVHCMPGEIVVVSMLGDANGDAPGGFAVLDAKTFDVLGRWEEGRDGVQFMYDFWYQPRQNALISSEWAAPKTFQPGFDLADVQAGKYGHSIHFWDLAERRVTQSIDLGEGGLIPLEVRWLHDPAATTGFVGAALSSAIFQWYREGDRWRTRKVIQVEPREVAGWPFPVPGLITDLVVSMDDRFLYFSNWLHGDLRQYDISDPANPRLTGQVWLGGVLGRPPSLAGRDLTGGPQMLQLSMDGRRLYVTNSLYSTWDNQFYPGLKSWLLKIDCHPEGGMTVAEDFHVDFGAARGHEIHLPGGDCTTEIFQ